MGLDLSKTHQLSADGRNWEMKPELRQHYRDALKAQLEDWVKGIDRHPENLPAGMDPECTPDFACCQPKLAWPMEIRQKFTNASPEEQERMLFSSLGSMLNNATEENPSIGKVYLTDGENSTLVGDDRKVKYPLH